MGEWFFVGALAQAEAIVFGVSSDCDLRFNIYTHVSTPSLKFYLRKSGKESPHRAVPSESYGKSLVFKRQDL